MLRAFFMCVLVCCLLVALGAQKNANAEESNQCDAPTLAFKQWLADKGIESESVELVSDAGGGMGRGLVAKKNIQEGELLIKAPMQWVMQSEIARRHPQLKHVLFKGMKVVPRGMRGEKLLIALLLMLEACKEGRKSAECKLRRERSEWKEYIDVLPKNFSSAPMFWSKSELAELKGSQILAMNEEDVKEVTEDFNVVEMLRRVDAELFCQDCFDKQRFRWASWIIHSRALTLQGIKFLIPMADMINYEPDDRDTLRRDHQELFLKYHKIDRALTKGFAEVLADRDFAEGQGIVESYGDNANHMYLRYFGFVPKDNPTDCVNVKVTYEKQDERANILRQLGFTTTMQACLRKGQDFPARMLIYLRVINLKESELSKAEMVKETFKQGVSWVVSGQNEKAALQHIISVIQAQLDGFPTSAKEDSKLLESGGLSSNKENAVRARLSEKRILRDTLRRMKALLKAVNV